jgi:hypothetical protein
VISIATPHAYVAAVAHPKHVIVPELIPSVARSWPLIADDQTVAASGGASDLPEGATHQDVVHGPYRRYPDRNKAARLPGKQVIARLLDPGRTLEIAWPNQDRRRDEALV